MQGNASQKQAKGKAEGNGALFYGCFALLVGKETCHMLRLALYGFVLLCLCVVLLFVCVLLYYMCFFVWF